jgi:acetylornithine deacetylase/succinyl-diaminopimelate desuccinylase-like protein
MRQTLALVRNAARLEQAALEIQQIPAPTFDERRRAQFVYDRMLALGLADVSQDDIGNVYGCRRGSGGRPAILLAAHLDTVFPAGTDLTARREDDRLYGPGIGDNSLGVAALLQLARALHESSAPNEGDIWFVADVGEEGLGDLRGMRAAIDKLGKRIGGVIAVEGSGFGRIYHRAIGVRRLRVEARAPGGHSWADYGSPSAVHVLVDLAAALARLRIEETPRTTLNIGVIHGGTSVNAIAEEAYLLLDLRSEGEDALERLAAAAEATIARTAVPAGASLTAQVVGRRRSGAIPESHPLAQAAAAVLREVGAAVVWGSGSTDANVPLARGIPAVCVGITTGGNAHRLDEYIDLAPIPNGMEALARLVWKLACAAEE